MAAVYMEAGDVLMTLIAVGVVIGIAVAGLALIGWLFYSIYRGM